MAPSLRVAAEIEPYFVVGLDWGHATAFGLRLVSTPRTGVRGGPGIVWPNFRSQRCPPVCGDTPRDGASGETIQPDEEG
jgi:hypothetical protein